jgi:hypothetical protein
VGRPSRRSKKPEEEKIRVEPSPGPPWLRRTLTVIGGLYVAMVLHQAVGNPHPVFFFAQIAKLFPGATQYTFEHRVQGYTCSGKLVDVDVRPFFPIHSDDKENRFDRAIHFYSKDRPTMQALEAYVMREYNRSEPDKIAGVALTRIQTPIPAPGTPFPRFERKPLSDYPVSERQVFYHTPKRVVDERCKKGDF